MDQQEDPAGRHRSALERLLAAGNAAFGGAAATLQVGFGTEGQVAAVVAGPIVAQTLEHVAGELVERMLGPRERQRIGAALAFALEEIRLRWMRGDQLRTDGF